MNEDYSEDERLIINTTQKFSAKKLNFVNQTVDDTGAWPEETIGDMGQLGLFGMIIPEAYGGVFKSYRLYYKVIYEIAKSCASHALILLSHSFCAHLIEIFGNQEQKTKWLPRMAAGELLGAVAMTEPDAGSDLAAIRTKAVASGEGYILNGRKRFITNGSKARVIVVVASTSSEKTFFSKSLFVVEKTALGFKSGKSENKMGFRGSDTSELYFDEVKLDKNSLLGKRGQGLIAIMKGFEFSRLAVASVALGIAESAHNEALSYAKRREQFGRSIGEFQTIQGYLADNETGLECGRLFLKNAA